MIYPELREIRSLDLLPPELPADPRVCAVRFEVVVGPKGADGVEAFSFTAVTAGFLSEHEVALWGRGYLILAEFQWTIVQHALARLLADCARPTWDEAATELAKQLRWQATGLPEG